MKHRITAALLALPLTVSLAACNGGNSSESDVPQPSKPDLEKAVHAYSDAYFGNDPETAYGMLTKRCAGKSSLDEYKSNLGTLATLETTAPTMKSLDSKVDGDTATVTYTYSDSFYNVSDQRWSVEDGKWKYDGC